MCNTIKINNCSVLKRLHALDNLSKQPTLFQDYFPSVIESMLIDSGSENPAVSNGHIILTKVSVN